MAQLLIEENFQHLDGQDVELLIEPAAAPWWRGRHTATPEAAPCLVPPVPAAEV